MTVVDEVTVNSKSITLVVRNESLHKVDVPFDLENIEQFDGTAWIPLTRKGYDRKAIYRTIRLDPGAEYQYTIILAEWYNDCLSPGEYRLPITYSSGTGIRTKGPFQDAWYFIVK